MSHHVRPPDTLDLPDSYLVIDTETNGLSIRDELTLPTQLGYLLVLDRDVSDGGAVVVDWSRVLPAHFRPAFWEKVRDVERRMAEQGRPCAITSARIRQEGVDPCEAWDAYRDLLDTAIDNGLKIAGHNIVGFDCPLLERVGLQMSTPLTFDPRRLIDLGLFEKVHGGGITPPAGGTTPRRGKWSLAYCIEKYGLVVDPARLHTADYDCWVVHQLAETYRALATGDGPSPTRPMAVMH